MKDNNRKKSKLVGLGLDNSDGHKRITQSDRFSIVGGSEETHSSLTETAIKTFEKLDKKGKTLDTVEKDELNDIIQDSIN
tara:strand:- start:248 stop:487 length:240 start_codon:yes stop_codon:yes gene_type:complete